ncbi:hypothetical protein [Actinomadura rayongensis]|uniref:Uncharacterized protein n=1 Tax=Actinomadura rayongensis TaxID=1429076 RepID=A0A6I4W717_9ACTN|nr:hypothetical protein [Actinomadura rayongensis]MXQ62492.1 hypothetical protein [Actinomadura rayongensis]
MGEYDRYARWADDNKAWIDAYENLRRSPNGFSFVRKLAKPELEDRYAVGDSYLFRTRRAEAAADAAQYDAEYEPRWEDYEAGMGAYLAVGKEFLDQATDPGRDLGAKHELLARDRDAAFLMHNAAVLWLERNEGAPRGTAQDYEEVLKALWLDKLRTYHPEWEAGAPTARQAALRRHLLGRDDQDVIPVWDDARLPGVRAASHVTLGKVLLRGDPPLPAGHLAHPSSWGLFLVSPLNDADRGFYAPDAEDAAWVRRLSARGVPDTVFRHDPARFQVYEIVPRPYGDPSVATPGVYLNRSQAHGRDDFLTFLPAGGGPLVFCTKGVGSDPALIGSPTARDYEFVKSYATAFKDPRTIAYPFAYTTLASQEGARAGSWRNIGFCAAYNGDEIAIVDHLNFQAMHQAAAHNPLTQNHHGFVQAIACVEINALPRTRVRLPATLLDDIEADVIGYPVQLVTASPVETCLRLSREGNAQDYVLGDPLLEADEWQRCFTSVPVPAAVAKAIDDDLAALEADIRAYVDKNDWTTVVGYPEAELGTRLALLRRRMSLAVQATYLALASWQVFLSAGWASDTYTGSFSGRNFNSGPRDSNEWGPLDRPSEAQEYGKPAGEGELCLHIDLANLRGLLTTSGELQKALLLSAGTYPSREEGDAAYYEATGLWAGCALAELSIAVTRALSDATRKLTAEICPTAMTKPAGDRPAYIAREVNTVIRDSLNRAPRRPLTTALFPWWA